jgi:chitodextrinase
MEYFLRTVMSTASPCRAPLDPSTLAFILDISPMLHHSFERETALMRCLSLLLAGLFLVAVWSPVHAQSGRTGDSFYGKLGVGVSDYTGDFPAQNTGHPFDFQEFIRGSGVPFVVAGEVGYQFSPKWALALGFQGGNYPIAGYSGGPSGIEDSYRYTPQLLGRYTFGRLHRNVDPYVDGGVNATFGGDSPPTNAGFGPSVGGGVDILIGRALSFYVESRFNLTLPDDAVDGADNKGPLDLTNQLLGFGLKVNFTTPTAPRVIALDGPTEVQTGETVTFAATVNEEEADRPMTYQWDFGEGETGSSRTATHVFNRPGTHAVTFSASNEAGEARKSITIKAAPPSSSSPSKGARIASLTATPNPVTVEEPIQFSSATEGSSAPTYRWSFGDGSTATGSSPTHTYKNPGRYTTRLEIPNEAGEDVRTVTVRVNPRTSQEPAERWRVVVASMRKEDGAQVLAQRYRNRFPAESMPVEIVGAETDQGLRFRVVVGTYEDADAARQALREHAEALPPDAWILRLR